MRTWPLTVSVALAAATVAPAQERPAFGFAGTVQFVRVRSDTVERRGPVFAGEARATLRGVTLAASLLEGQLQSATAGSPRDLVEARIVVAGRPLPWLELAAGPVVRAYVADSSTERWVFWQGRARVDAPILVNRVTSYVELWRSFSSQANLGTPAGRVQGGEAGVVYLPPRSRVWVRLGYRIDDAAVSAVGSETLEAITFTVGTGVW